MILPGRSAPTLVIGGANDPFYGADRIRQAAELIPNAELCLIAGGGHAVVKAQTKIFEDKFSSFFNEGGITAAGALLMSVSMIILKINTAGIVENNAIIVISSVQKFLLIHSPRSVE